MSVGTVTQRLETRRRVLGVLGALLVHAGAVGYFAGRVPSTEGFSGPVQGAAAGGMTVSLIRSTAAAQMIGGESGVTDRAALPLRLRHPAMARDNGVTALGAGARKGPGRAIESSVSVRAAQAGDQDLDTIQAGNAGAVGSDYQRRLLAHIEPFKRYPADAGANGIVQLVFEINRDGGVLGVWVAKSSGSAVLDAAAVDMVRRSQPVPAIPDGLPDLLTVRLPVAFSEHG